MTPCPAPGSRRGRAAARPASRSAPEPIQAGGGQHEPSTSLAAACAAACPRCRADLARPRGPAARPQLGAAAQRARADPGALAHRASACSPHQASNGLGPPRRGRDRRARASSLGGPWPSARRRRSRPSSSASSSAADPAATCAARAVAVAGGRDLDERDVAADQRARSAFAAPAQRAAARAEPERVTRASRRTRRPRPSPRRLFEAEQLAQERRARPCGRRRRAPHALRSARAAAASTIARPAPPGARVALASEIPAARVLGRQPPRSLGVRAQRGRVGTTSSAPSQPANAWISSSTIASARRPRARRTIEIRAHLTPAARPCPAASRPRVARTAGRCRAARRGR